MRIRGVGETHSGPAGEGRGGVNATTTRGVTRLRHHPGWRDVPRRGRDALAGGVAALRRHPVRTGSVAVLAVAVAGALGWLLWASPYARLESVEVRGVDGTTGRSVAALAGEQQGRPLVEVDPDRVAAEVGALRPVERAVAHRSWPHTLVVDVTPRVPVVALGGGGSRVELVDGAGESIGAGAAPAGVPLVSLARPDDAGLRRVAVAVARSLTAAQRASVADFAVDARGVATFRLGGVDVAWGGPDEGRLKAMVVDRLARRDGVRAIDVTAPLTPTTTG